MLKRVRPRVIAGPIPRHRVAGPAKTEPAKKPRPPTAQIVPRMPAEKRRLRNIQRMTRAPYSPPKSSFESLQAAMTGMGPKCTQVAELRRCTDDGASA
jgi:hypothetical protein